jgi:hypothetical protein
LPETINHSIGLGQNVGQIHYDIGMDGIGIASLRLALAFKAASASSCESREIKYGYGVTWCQSSEWVGEGIGDPVSSLHRRPQARIHRDHVRIVCSVISAIDHFRNALKAQQI